MIICAKSVHGNLVRVNFLSTNIKHSPKDGTSELSDLLGKFRPIKVDTSRIPHFNNVKKGIC